MIMPSRMPIRSCSTPAGIRETARDYLDGKSYRNAEGFSQQGHGRNNHPHAEGHHQRGQVNLKKGAAGPAGKSQHVTS
jgi:hypothetical protein